MYRHHNFKNELARIDSSAESDIGGWDRRGSRTAVSRRRTALPMRRTCAVAITLAVAACGSAQGTFTHREGRHTGQHAAADDHAAQIEYRRAALSLEMGRPEHAPADGVERWIEAHKLILGKH
jgi:hypothetical protein